MLIVKKFGEALSQTEKESSMWQGAALRIIKKGMM